VLTRALCGVVAAGPVLVVSFDLVNSFGWSMQAVSGIIGMFAVYAAIVWATQFTFAPQLDGWSLPRWELSVIVGVAATAVLPVAPHRSLGAG
jgi:hypothetical protein